MTLYIGLMSGTSMDGIDAALVDLPGNTLLCGITKPYSDEVKQRLIRLLQEPHTTLEAVCQLNTLIGRDFAQAVLELLQKAQVSAGQITAIGSHGQTVCHNTKASIPYTLQLGCGHTIASHTRISVVADFRTKDLVNGGEGAPFAPLYHQQLFSKQNRSVAVVNIGGIANISIINPNKPMIGWDVGPGNCLMDAWILKQQGKSYDKNGSWAAEGKVINALLSELLNDAFAILTPPKSIGKEYYSLSWLESHLKSSYKPEDIQATLLTYTARCIADNLLHLQASGIKELYICGGGVHNILLKNKLSDFLPGILVESCATLGYDPDYIEAMMFAWLAEQNINQQPLDLSSITGSNVSQILGARYF